MASETVEITEADMQAARKRARELVWMSNEVDLIIGNWPNGPELPVRVEYKPTLARWIDHAVETFAEALARARAEGRREIAPALLKIAQAARADAAADEAACVEAGDERGATRAREWGAFVDAALAGQPAVTGRTEADVDRLVEAARWAHPLLAPYMRNALAVVEKMRAAGEEDAQAVEEAESFRECIAALDVALEPWRRG